MKKIREKPTISSIPVFVLISHESEKNLVKEHNLIVDGYIQRPLDSQKLKEVSDKIFTIYPYILERAPRAQFHGFAQKWMYSQRYAMINKQKIGYEGKDPNGYIIVKP